MPRARGNARKKKARLTERTLSAVMEVARPRKAPEEEAAASLESTEPVIATILELLRAEPEMPSMPAIYNEASRAYRNAAGFPSERYVIGLAVCPACHNENIYYQDRDLLSSGFTFRCRVCQHELQPAALD